MSDTDKTDVIFQRSKLLNRYYEKVAKAAAGIGHCPRFWEFGAGFGLVDQSDVAHPKLLDIPANMSEVPNEFYRAELTAEYSQGVTMCACEIPAGAVSEPVQYNLIGIYDQDNELVAVCTTFPDWVTPTEAERVMPALAYPLDKSVSEANV